MHASPVILAVAGAMHTRQGSPVQRIRSRGSRCRGGGVYDFNRPPIRMLGVRYRCRAALATAVQTSTGLGGPGFGSTKDGFDFVFPGLPMALPGGAACGLWHYHFTVVLCASYRCSLGVFGARYRLRPHHVGIFGRSCVLVAQCRGAPFVESGPRVFGYVAVLAEVEDGFLFGHAVDSAVFPSPYPVHWVRFSSM